MKSFFIKDILTQTDTSRTDCFNCGKDKKCKHPKLEPTGLFGKKILIINDNISEPSDRRGNHLSGAEKSFLADVLRKNNISLENDCLLTSSVICQSDYLDISDVRLCKNNILNIIKEKQPKAIICFGLAAIQSIFCDRIKMSGDIVRWEGFHIPDPISNCWVTTSYSLKEIEENKLGNIISKKIANGIKRSIKYLDVPITTLTLDKYKSKCKLLFSSIDVKKLLKLIISEPDVIAFDYESNGLNFNADWFEIKTISIYYKGYSYAFKLTKDIFPLFKRVLIDSKIKKVGANIKFEQGASKKIFKCEVKGWIHDTVIAAHIIDNRTGISSVNFQCFVNLGVPDYGEELGYFLRSKDKNGPNKIHEAPLKDLLLYNALDSLFEYSLYEVQKRVIRRNQTTAGYELFHNGTLALSKVEHTGFTIDVEYLNEQENIVDAHIQRIEKKLEDDPVIQRWKEKYGTKYNIDSDTQMRDILFSEDELNLEPQKFTAKLQPSTDKEALQKLDLSFFDDKMDMIKYNLVKNTYIGQISNCITNGKIHPNYALNKVTTYRGSCYNPNFQNIPIRDKEIGKMIRGGIVPRPGNLICELDYSGAEVRIAYCYNRDPILKNYLMDSSTDMHRDVAMDCFQLPKEEITGGIRFLGKNDFTFAQFYGDYYKNCALALWNDVKRDRPQTTGGLDLWQHLRDTGFRTYSQFENHIREVEDIFWNKRFKVYSAWKKKFYSAYIKRGYIDTLTGFRLTRVMDRKNAINYPIQGSSFHCLLWALIRLVKELSKLKFESKVIGQVHDSIILDIIPEEREAVLKLAKRVLTIDVREKWTWIDIPFEVECEISDTSWFDKKEVII